MSDPLDLPPAALPDPILPPSLAYDLGQEASARATFHRTGTSEGRFLPGIGPDGVRRCDCEEPPTAPRSTHPKPDTGGGHGPVRDLFAGERRGATRR